MSCEKMYHGEDGWCPRPATYWVLLDKGPLGQDERALCNVHASGYMVGADDFVRYIEKMSEGEDYDQKTEKGEQ